MQPRTRAFRGWIKRGAIALTALLLLAGLAGCAQRPAKFPTGTFTTTITEADVTGDIQKESIGGDWQISFRDDGTFSVSRHDVEVDYGTYTTGGNMLSMVDEGGTYMPIGDAVNSTYSWAVDKDGSLRFTAVEDTHPDRPIIMQSHPWVKAE